MDQSNKQEVSLTVSYLAIDDDDDDDALSGKVFYGFKGDSIPIIIFMAPRTVLNRPAYQSGYHP